MRITFLRSVLTLFFWLVTGLLALYLVMTAASYFHFQTDYFFLKAKQDLLPNKLWLTCFYLHLAGGIVAVVTGFPLFFERWITVHGRTHKLLGRAYVYSILLVSGPTGFYLAFFAEGGPLASIGMICMSLIWIGITFRAVQQIIRGDVNAHRRWMIRSFCFTLSGITLRLYTPFGAHILGLDAATNFIISSYLPWMINLFIGELLVRYTDSRSLQKNLSAL